MPSTAMSSKTSTLVFTARMTTPSCESGRLDCELSARSVGPDPDVTSRIVDRQDSRVQTLAVELERTRTGMMAQQGTHRLRGSPAKAMYAESLNAPPAPSILMAGSGERPPSFIRCSRAMGIEVPIPTFPLTPAYMSFPEMVQSPSGPPLPWGACQVPVPDPSLVRTCPD